MPHTGSRCHAPFFRRCALGYCLLLASAALMARLAIAADPADGTFRPVADMSFARYSGAATLLDSGAAVLYGPSFDGDEFDPGTGTWVETAHIPSPRYNARLFPLTTGDALLIGGDPTDARTIRYVPATKGWTWGPSLETARRFEQATVLTDGRIFVAGGYGPNGSPLSSAELYDPSTDMFSTTGAMPRPRAGGVAEVLPNGRVLVAGGVDASGFGDPCSVIYSPPTGTFSTGPCFNAASNGLFVPASVRLADGRVLVSGGYTYIGGGQRVAAAAEMYDPATNQWTARLASARAEHTLTRLADGRVLAVGGINDWAQPVAQTEIFDPAREAFHAGPALGVARLGHTATAVPGNRGLVAGGLVSGNAWTSTAEMYVGDALCADGFEQ